MRGDNNNSRNIDFEEVTLAVSARMKSAMEIISNRYLLSQKVSNFAPHGTISSEKLSNSANHLKLSNYADSKGENGRSCITLIRLPRNIKFHNGW